MKILIYAPIKYPNAEIDYILTVSKRLTSQGFEIVIMSLPGYPMTGSAQKAGLTVETRFNLKTLNPAKLAANLAACRKWMKAEKFDLVDAHRSEGFVPLARMVKKLSPAPALVRTRQDMRPVRSDPFNRKAYNSADRIIVSNRLLADDLSIRLQLPPGKVSVIYYGINPEDFQPKKNVDAFRIELGIDPAWRIIALSARLGIVKGHEYFLAAAEKIAAEFSDARFLVSYRMVEKESDFFSRLKKSPVKEKFLVFGPRDDRADLLNLCEVGVLTSVGSEASSRACLEWMALKKPLVVTRVGVLPELVRTGDTGYLFMPRYASGLAEAVVRLLRYPDRAKEMGEKGYQLLKENFTEDIMIEQTVKIFKELGGRKNA
jgi:glycosyltransferase involved in cell wall biosynthesis